VQALVVDPGVADSARVAEVAAVAAAPQEVLLRVLEVGVCGTDREIVHGLFGVPPDGERTLVLGHEALAVVEQDGHGLSRGDLVTATVRRSCHHCLACEEGAPDSCLTGDYSERGITRLDGFARELVAEDPDQLVAIPRSLGRLGVLAEPTSICARALRHARAIGDRQPWRLQRALVIGAGSIGTLTTVLLRLADIEVWVASTERVDDPRADLVDTCGARYVSLQDEDLGTLERETGGFDLVVEAAGDAQLMADCIALLRRSGILCILGIDGREQRVGVDGRVLGVDMILENRVVFGSVNAHRSDWRDGVAALDRVRTRWPGALDALIAQRLPLDRFADALAARGGKATLVLDDQPL
jgi:threonine dehydrogenase-like Zn-dependent dehydrogenase